MQLLDSFRQRHKILFTGAMVVTAVALLAAATILWQEIGFIVMGLFLLLAAVFLGTWMTNYVVLNEMEVGVVFDHRGNFVCFLDNDYGRITPRADNDKWHDDESLKRVPKKPTRRHRINPATEVMKTKLRKGSFDASGTSRDVRTLEGIPINIPWTLSFRIEVLRIKPGIEYKLARALPEYAGNMVGGRVTQILQHVVGQKRIAELYSPPGSESAIKALEDEVRAELLKRTRALGVTGIDGHDLKLGPIALPGKIEATLRESYQRQLNASTMANALSTLQKAVAEFSVEDMQRLTELERLRIIDDKTKSFFLSDSFFGVRKGKGVDFFDSALPDNGRGEEEDAEPL